MDNWKKISGKNAEKVLKAMNKAPINTQKALKPKGVYFVGKSINDS